MTFVKFKNTPSFLNDVPFTKSMEHMLNQFIGNWDFNGQDLINDLKHPKANISETDQAFNLQFAIAGYSKEDVKIEIKNQKLMISAASKEEINSETENIINKGFKLEGFQKSLQLPENVNVDAIQAKVEHGILNITLPKAELPNSKSISIS